MPDQQQQTTWLDAARHVVAHGFTIVQPDGTFGPPSEAEWQSLEEGEMDAPGDVEPTGGVVLDRFTASMLVQVHDALNDANAAKFAALSLDRAVTVGWRVVK